METEYSGSSSALPEVNIEANVKAVTERLASAVKKSGRAMCAVRLLAATKTRTPVEIQRAIQAGITLCGENRAQELLEKLPQNAYGGAELHFIGAFQSNKAHLLAGKTAMIESVGTRKAAEILSRLGVEGGFTTDALLEVNVGTEAAKSGFAASELDGVCESLAVLPGIRLRGLMAIPPAGEDPRPYFAEMRRLFEGLGANLPQEFDTLSMGMSGDFEIAVEEGSTLVRVGTGIFGPRNYGVQV